MTLRSDRTSPAPAGDPGHAGREPREVEWQLAAPDLSGVRRWLDQHTALDGLSIEPLPTLQLHDTYLDTEDWRVFRAGFALRLRDEEGRAEATLKGLRSARDDVADRRELTEPLPESRAKALAQATGPVGSRVRAVTGVKPLGTLFEVRTSRRRYAVRKRDPVADVGEIALDEAQFLRGNGLRPLVLTRVELEAMSADSAPLERLVERLCTECGLRPATENKFTVGLRSASLQPPLAEGPGGDSGPPPPVMDASARARDFAAASLGRLVSAWRAHEPAARLGETPDALHALRVTGRRMDTVLGLFRPYLPASLGKKGRAKLKSLLDALGAVRDADIRLEVVRTFRSGLPEGDRHALGPLLGHLQSERGGARSRMLRALDAKPTRHWLETLPGQLARAAPPRAPTTSPRNAAALDVIPDLIRRRYRKLRECARRLNAQSSLGEYHKVRVRAKKLRYALEAVAPTYQKPADEMLAALHKLQNKLGTQHDSDVVARYLTQLAAQPPPGFGGQTLFLMGRLVELHAQQAARMGGKARKPWRRVRGKHWKALRSRMKELRDGTSRLRVSAGNAKDGSAIGAPSSGPASRHTGGT